LSAALATWKRGEELAVVVLVAIDAAADAFSHKLVPVAGGEDDIFGFFEGKGSVKGDIVSPALSPNEWGELD
jgi:hypothetical protein